MLSEYDPDKAVEVLVQLRFDSGGTEGDTRELSPAGAIRYIGLTHLERSG